MRILDIRERSFALSRYADPAVDAGALTTSLVAVVTDQQRSGKPIIGYGFASIGRFAQSGLIRERFAPRLLRVADQDLCTEAGDNLAPDRCWRLMMQGEKPGGHGERCVAVGTLDMAIWDAAAKIADLPLYRFLAARQGRHPATSAAVELYASGGYPYPADDATRLRDEIKGFLDQGYQRVKIKIGATTPDEDLRRIEIALKLLPAANLLAVDAMNRYDAPSAITMAQRLSLLGLMWSEDLCDPLDFETQSDIARLHAPPWAAGEALFSVAEARLLLRHGGLRPDRDILLFDPVHCYGLSHYFDIVATMEAEGWNRRSFWPHGGHLFSLHVAAGLGLGGSEINPLAFQPVAGLGDGQAVAASRTIMPDLAGIGLESRAALAHLLATL
jgi:L-alanine-DL-glutamate epimerase-like enolase superfamily enzyme